MKPDYEPSPIDTADVVLPPEAEELTELLATNAHDHWAVGRIEEGWTYGEQRDDVLKRHPCLVPYTDLPDSEKEYDRKTAMETLKALHVKGFTVMTQKKADMMVSACEAALHFTRGSIPFERVGLIKTMLKEVLKS